ncbi:MAG: hypothetical protein ABIH41_05680, partial [Nanoarchaeota archaeon]
LIVFFAWYALLSVAWNVYGAWGQGFRAVFRATVPLQIALLLYIVAIPVVGALTWGGGGFLLWILLAPALGVVGLFTVLAHLFRASKA